MNAPVRGFYPQIDFSASPTLWDFFWDNSFFTGVEGPFGSGKTTAAIAKLGRFAMEQEVSPDGYRRTRWAVIRNTYAELKTTTLESWQEIFKPEKVGRIIYSQPIVHHIRVAPKGKPGDADFVPGIDMKVWFLALDRPTDVRKLKSLQLTGALVEEATEIMQEIIEALTGRVGRYPSLGSFEDTSDDIDAEDRGQSMGGVGATWAGIIAVTNSGDDLNWWHRFKTSPTMVRDIGGISYDFRFYVQPMAVLEVEKTTEGFQIVEPASPLKGERVKGASVYFGAGRYWTVNPQAENLRWLRPGYYQMQIANKTLDWIQRYLQVKTIYVAGGKPWVPEFIQESMVGDFDVDPALELFGGLDCGGNTLNNACEIGQRGVFGDLRVVFEFVMFDMGLDSFSDGLIQALAQRNIDWRMVRFTADPASRTKDGIYKVAAIDHLRSKKFQVREASTNDPEIRREALALPMGRLIKLGNGRQAPGFLVDRRCTWLIAGLAGKWSTRRIQVAGTERFTTEPEKNAWSHPCEAGGYLAMGMGEDRNLTRNRRPGQPGDRPMSNHSFGDQTIVHGIDWSPFS